MRLRSLPPLAAALVLAGCFAYRPVTTTPPAGATLEAVLSDSGSINVTPRVGPNAGTILGTLAAARGDTIEIAISEVRTRNGQTYYLQGATVALHRGDLAQLRVRTLDRRRTTVAAIAGVVGAIAIAQGIRLGGGGGGDGGGGGGTPAMRPVP